MQNPGHSDHGEPFRWSAGGWFGTQLGGTLWLLLLGLVLLLKDAVAAAGVLTCFAGANVVGLSLWRRRDRILLYPALQWMTAACGVASLIALAFLDSRPDSVEVAPAIPYWVLLIFPGFMLMLWLRRRSAARRQTDGATGGGS